MLQERFLTSRNNLLELVVERMHAQLPTATINIVKISLLDNVAMSQLIFKSVFKDGNRTVITLNVQWVEMMTALSNLFSHLTLLFLCTTVKWMPLSDIQGYEKKLPNAVMPNTCCDNACHLFKTYWLMGIQLQELKKKPK